MSFRRALFSISFIAGPYFALPDYRRFGTRFNLILGHNDFRAVNELAAKRIYTPLDPKKNQIRLLSLCPGSESDEILCTLSVTSLDDKPQYTALSYTWGDPIRRSQSLWSIRGIYQYFRALFWRYFRRTEQGILLEGIPYQITHNLANALRCLRRKDEAQVLWVDALCINQEDSKEKSFQVQKMKDIYSQAHATRVWLGPSADDSDSAMNFIRQSGRIDVEAPNFKASDLSPPWPALQALFARSWWTRIWIVQEVFMSSNVVIQCGKEQVDMSLFTDLVKKERRLREILRTGKYRGFSQHVRWNFVPPGNPFYVLLDFWRQERQFHEEKPTWESLTHLPFIGSISNAWLAYSKATKAVVGTHSIANWLFMTQSFESTLKRDMVFAVLGLVRDEDRGAIVPDYSDTKQDRDVYKEAAVCVLGQDATLALLQFAKARSKSIDLPSWVPDFSAGRPLMFNMSSMGYQADDGIQSWAKLTPHKAFKKSSHPNTPADIGAWAGKQLAFFLPIHFGLLLFRKSSTFVQSITTRWHLLWYTDTTLLGALKYGNWQNHYAHFATFSEDLEAINVEGLVFDEIAVTDPSPDFGLVTGNETVWMDRQEDSMTSVLNGNRSISLLTRTLKRWGEMAASFQPTRGPTDQLWHKARFSEEAFWRTMILDRFRMNNSFVSPPASFGQVYKSIMNPADVSHLNRKEFLASILLQGRLATTIMTNTNTRSFMMTSSGAMGFAPSDARPGDIICVLRGGTTPFVLRPRDEDGGSYELVGACFVYGIMHGQFTRQARPEDVRTFSIV